MLSLLNQQNDTMTLEQSDKLGTYNPLDNDLLASIEKWDGAISPVFGLITKIIGSLMYDMEKGQIRSEEELNRTVSLFAYGIDILDFAVPTPLSHFVQVRAMMKLGIKLGISEDVLVQACYSTYYVGLIDTSLQSTSIKQLTLYYNDLKRRLETRGQDIYYPNIN
jgi:hypothetical protein